MDCRNAKTPVYDEVAIQEMRDALLTQVSEIREVADARIGKGIIRRNYDREVMDKLYVRVNDNRNNTLVSTAVNKIIDVYEQTVENDVLVFTIPSSAYLHKSDTLSIRIAHNKFRISEMVASLFFIIVLTYVFLL